MTSRPPTSRVTSSSCSAACLDAIAGSYRCRRARASRTARVSPARHLFAGAFRVSPVRAPRAPEFEWSAPRAGVPTPTEPGDTIIMRPRGFLDVRWWAAFALGLLFLLPAQAADDNKLTIRTLSNRADLISDGDALVEIKAAAGVDASKVTVTLNDVNVTSAFVVDAAKGTLR